MELAGGHVKRIPFAAAWLAAFLATPGLAQQTKVGDWTIEKRTQDQHCNASRGYRDSEDGNHDYAIVLSYSNAVIVIVLIYDGWEWDNVGDMLRADIATDNDDIMRKAKWEVINNTTVRGVFQLDRSSTS